MRSNLKIETRNFSDIGQHGDLLLPQDIVHVWKRLLHDDATVIQSGYELLCPQERERAARFRVDRPRNDFILTRGALRSLLARYLATTPEQLQFQVTKYGKPWLEGTSDLRFNVSHSEGLALLAFVRGREIGVDVERIRPQPDARELAERFFSVREREGLRAFSGRELQAAFFRCWSRKEAYIKARGEGLSLPLAQFDVSVEQDASRILLATRPDFAQAERWCVRNLVIDSNYAGAVAVEL